MTALLVAALVAAPHPGCVKTFSRPMIVRAIDAAFAGTREVTARDRRHLRRFIRCRRPAVSRSRMMRYWRTAEAAWHGRRNPPLEFAEASWYYDGGSTASGYHATYGVANKYLAFGTHVRFVYHGRSVDAVVDDRGPYVGGRVWDLNQNTAGALGFGGVDTVGYHIG